MAEDIRRCFARLLQLFVGTVTFHVRKGALNRARRLPTSCIARAIVYSSASRVCTFSYQSSTHHILVDYCFAMTQLVSSNIALTTVVCTSRVTMRNECESSLLCIPAAEDVPCHGWVHGFPLAPDAPFWMLALLERGKAKNLAVIHRHHYHCNQYLEFECI
jgi:hypothetical protein